MQAGQGCSRLGSIQQKMKDGMKKRLAASQVQGHVKIQACERIVAHTLRELAQENEAGLAIVEECEDHEDNKESEC